MRMGLGPTIRKLESYPPVLDLVFGAYGEASDGVKKLLDKMVESRVASLGLRKGTQEAGKEMSLVTGYLRRRLSSAVMRANVKCLLERLAGEGQEGQAGRRSRLRWRGKSTGWKGLLAETSPKGETFFNCNVKSEIV